MTIYAELLLMLYNLTFFPASDRTTCDCTSIFRNTINPDLIISHHQEFCKKTPQLWKAIRGIFLNVTGR